MVKILFSLCLLFLLGPAARANELVDAVLRLGPLSPGEGPARWKAVSFVPLFDARFPTYHPQGIKLLGTTLFLTTVQGKVTGAGHLVRYLLDSAERPASARALGRLTFPAGPDGRLIHAGGLDGDGENLYVPLAGYRPEGPAEIFRVSVATQETRPIAWLDDHVGTLAYGRDERAFHLVDWSTGLYTIPFAALDFTRELTIRLPKSALAEDWEYQDCKSAGDGYALCSAKHGALWPTGEIHLVRFTGAGLEVVHRIPVPNLRADGSAGGTRPLTFNAMDFSPIRSSADPVRITGVRFYFVPYDDEDSRLMIFDGVGG